MVEIRLKSLPKVKPWVAGALGATGLALVIYLGCAVWNLTNRVEKLEVSGMTISFRANRNK